MNVLLVEPEFPIPYKSKNHSSFLPIGLLKLANYYSHTGNTIQLVRGNERAEFYPDQILITSLFTYWSIYVKESVVFYKILYPKAKIIVGGIYASLMPDHCKKYTGCDEVFIGIHPMAEKCLPAYELVDVDYQIIHGMRGCTRKCPFCGIWKLEEKHFKSHKKIKKEITSNKLVFYDNNMLANPNIKAILEMLASIRVNDRVVICECQSGFDGRIIEEDPELAYLLKQARFKNIRFAWDFAFEQYQKVEKWIEIFKAAGYNPREMFVFMIYNWSFDFEELEKKRKKCYELGVQISDCRFRPLTQTFDNYSSHASRQSGEDYYIHSNWTDEQIRQFRRNVRQHNICIRQKISWADYSRSKEKLFARSKNRIYVAI
jgi:hypothetical protein